jgi:hypothetical protein
MKLGAESNDCHQRLVRGGVATWNPTSLRPTNIASGPEDFVQRESDVTEEEQEV